MLQYDIYKQILSNSITTAGTKLTFRSFLEDILLIPNPFEEDKPQTLNELINND